MEFPLLIEELGQRTGLDSLRLDEQDCCSVLFDDTHEVEFQWDRQSGTVITWCTVGDLRDLPEPVCRRLLAGSALGVGTEGAAFGIYEPLGAVILWKRREGGYTDYEDFTADLNRFIGQCGVWKAKIRDLLKEAPPAPVMTDVFFP